MLNLTEISFDEAKKLYQKHLKKCQDLFKSETMTPEQQEAFDASSLICETLKSKYPKVGVPVCTPVDNKVPTGDFPDNVQINVPAKKLNCLSGDSDAVKYKAKVAANYFRAMAGDVVAALWLQQNGIQISNTHQEGVNTSGGYTVPTTLLNDVIRLMNEYGIFRANSHVRTMKTDKVNIPRRVSGFTPYFVGENEAGTVSDKAFDLVSLVARKLMILTSITNELYSDSAINLIDDFFEEFAMAMAQKEDECGFNGTGTSTYGGILGIVQRLSTVNGVDDGGGLVLGAGNAYSEITNQNLCTMVTRCPTYARKNAKWYLSPACYGQTILRLQAASGGTNAAMLANGILYQQHLNYPIVFAEVLPVTEGNSQICILFGDLSKATSFGDRMDITFAISSEATVGSTSMFETDSVGLRAVERFDINVHDIGSATAAGPVVGLITAAS